MLGRRREQKRAAAAIAEGLERVSACFVSDPDKLEVRASVVLHVGEDPAAPFAVAHLAFSEDDRVPIYMDGDLAALVYETEWSADVAEGAERAEDWIGDGAWNVAFSHLPGIYQAAYIAWVTGTMVESDETQFMWALPGEGDRVPMREFPPRVKPTEATPVVGEVSFVSLPGYVVDGLFRARGW